jgi:hypothetical protein
MVTYRDQDASDGGGPPMHRHEAPAPWLHHPSFQPANDRVVPPRRMDHTYRDYTYFPTGDLPAAAASTTPTTFPKKLHRLLSDPENEHVSKMSRDTMNDLDIAPSRRHVMLNKSYFDILAHPSIPTDHLMDGEFDSLYRSMCINVAIALSPPDLRYTLLPPRVRVTAAR